jgi:hypothetical protein
MEKKPKVIPTEYEGVLFRSRTEARWAVFLRRAGFRFEYEREGYDLDGTWYLPDFWLPDCKAWLEVLGEKPRKDEFRRATKLAEASGRIVLIALKPPSTDDPMIFCGPESQFPVGDLCLFMGDRRDEGCVWLAEYELRWAKALFGSGTNHDRSPGANFAPTGDAYRAASNERFESKRRDRL